MRDVIKKIYIDQNVQTETLSDYNDYILKLSNMDVDCKIYQIDFNILGFFYQCVTLSLNLDITGKYILII